MNRCRLNMFGSVNPSRGRPYFCFAPSIWCSRRPVSKSSRHLLDLLISARSSWSFSSLTKSFSKSSSSSFLLFGVGYAFLGKPSRFSQMFGLRNGIDVFSRPMIEKLYRSIAHDHLTTTYAFAAMATFLFPGFSAMKVCTFERPLGCQACSRAKLSTSSLLFDRAILFMSPSPSPTFGWMVPLCDAREKFSHRP